MNPLTIARVILSWLSFAQTEIGPNIAELKQTVSANDLALEKAITKYEAFGFSTLSELGRLQFDPYRKHQVAKFMEISANLTVDDLSDDQYGTYRQMIERSKENLIYSNAARITDLFKTDALYIAVMNNNSDSKDDYKYVHFLLNIKEMRSTEIVDIVFKVIQEEKSVLVNGRFVKRNSKLNSLYWELRKVGYSSFFYLPFRAEELYEKCALPSTGCGIKLRRAIHNRIVLKKKAESCLPIDSKLKVYELLPILSDSINADNEMFDALEAANLKCLISFTKDACKKRSDN